MKKVSAQMSWLIIGILLLLTIPACTADMEARTVIDAVGREVTIPAEINSIVSIYPDSTRVIVALNMGDLITGADTYSHRCPVLKNAASYLSEASDVGNPYDNTLSLEEIAKIHPDVVFISGRLTEIADKIQNEVGIPTICIQPTIKEYDDFLKTVELISTALNADERGSELTAYMKGKFENIIERTSDLDDSSKPTVLVINTPHTSDPLTVMASIHPSTLQYAGGKNVASELELVGASGSPWRTVSFEQILNWNPEYIFIHGMGLLTPDSLKTLDDWGSLPAVKEDNIYKVFIGYVGYDPALLIVQADHMAKILHPELLKDMSFSNESDEVFTKIYGKSGIYKQIESELGLSPIMD